jgi:hypothetical protein
VSVLLNAGNGAFAAKVDYATGAGPASVTAADFDGDGRLDLAVATFNNILRVRLNAGNGTFGAGIDYLTGTNPQSLASADFNGDGRPDLAVANGDDSNVSVLLNSCLP